MKLTEVEPLNRKTVESGRALASSRFNVFNVFNRLTSLAKSTGIKVIQGYSRRVKVKTEHQAMGHRPAKAKAPTRGLALEFSLPRSHERSHSGMLIPVVLGLVGTFDRHAEVVGLLLRELDTSIGAALRL